MKEFDEEQQEHVNSLISGAKKKVKDTLEIEHSEAIKAKDTEIAGFTSKVTELETKVKTNLDLSLSEDEHRKAQNLRFDTQENDMKTLRTELAEEREAIKMAKFDSSDKDALIEAGFKTAYVDNFLLPKVASNRGINEGKAFYKDSSGAEIDRGVIIDSLVKAHPELVTINRPPGNDVAHGDSTAPKASERFDQLLSKSQNGPLPHGEQIELSSLANDMKQKQGE